MKYNLTKNQIDIIRQKSFLPIILKKVILDYRSGKYNLNISFFLEEEINEDESIIKKENSQYLKIKVIASNSTDTTDKFSSALDMIEVENILHNTSTPNRDVFVSTDYDKTSDLILSGKKILSYNCVLEIESIKDIDLCFFMYYDHNEIVLDRNLTINDINTEIFCGNIDKFSIISDSKDVTSGQLQDLTAIQRITRLNKEKLNKISELARFKTQTSEPLKITVNKNNLAPLFSELYPSRNIEGGLTFLFFCDFNNIISRSCTFDFSRSTSEDLKRSIINSCRIASLKINRREYDRKNNLKTNSYKTIAVTSNNENNFLNTVENEKSRIREMNVSGDLKTVEVLDKNIFKESDEFAEYGVEITLNNPFYSYFNGLISILKNGVYKYEEYLRHTTNIDYYDYVLQKFTGEYINNITQNQFLYGLQDSVQHISYISSIFGLVENSEEFRQTLEHCSDPNSTTPDIISKIINIFEKMVTFLTNYISSNTDTFIKLEYWFKNNIIDCSDHDGCGYQYIMSGEPTSFKTLTNVELENLFLGDLRVYLRYINPNIESIIPFSMPSPRFKLYNKIFEVRKNLSNDSYVNFEIGIKNYNLLKNRKNYNIEGDTPANIFGLLDANNVFVEKIYSNTKSTKLAAKTDISSNIYEENPESKNLFLLLSRKKNRKFNKINDSEKENKLVQTPPQVYYQTFRDDVSEPSATTSKFYRLLYEDIHKDIPLLSNFFFVFNTFCTIEYKRISKQNISSSWKKLTKNELRTIDIDETILCRFRNFQDSSLNISDFDEIRLPILNEHFLVKKSANTNTIFSFDERPRPQIQVSANIRQYVLDIKPLYGGTNMTFRSYNGNIEPISLEVGSYTLTYTPFGQFSNFRKLTETISLPYYGHKILKKVVLQMKQPPSFKPPIVENASVIKPPVPGPSITTNNVFTGGATLAGVQTQQKLALEQERKRKEALALEERKRVLRLQSSVLDKTIRYIRKEVPKNELFSNIASIYEYAYNYDKRGTISYSEFLSYFNSYVSDKYSFLKDSKKSPIASISLKQWYLGYNYVLLCSLPQLKYLITQTNFVKFTIDELLYIQSLPKQNDVKLTIKKTNIVLKSPPNLLTTEEDKILRPTAYIKSARK